MADQSTKGRGSRARASRLWLGIQELEETFAEVRGYRPLRQVHSGSRSAVLAAQASDGRQVALKVVRRSHPDRRRKSASEFGRLNAAQSRYVIECLELIESAGVLVLELLEPPRLYSAESRIQAAIEICRALSNLHELPDPLFHLDVKPANIGRRIVGDDSRYVIFDFGGAKFSSQLRSAQQLEPLGPGKQLMHRAPEVNGRIPSRVGPWSDLYSVGILLQPALKKTQNPDLDALVAKLLHDDFRRRPDSASEVAQLLEDLWREVKR